MEDGLQGKMLLETNMLVDVIILFVGVGDGGVQKTACH